MARNARDALIGIVGLDAEDVLAHLTRAGWAIVDTLARACNCNLPAGVSSDFHTVWCATRTTGRPIIDIPAKEK